MSNTYTLGQAESAIRFMIMNPLPHDQREVPYLEGNPGLGKTSVYKAIYESLKRSDKNPTGFTHFVTIVAPEREPVDFGLPVLVETRDAVKLVPLDTLKFGPDDRPFILIDEIDKANNMLQNVLGRIMNDLEIGNTKLPANSFVGAAGNKMTDRAGSFAANTHIKTRRVTIPVRVDAKEWVNNIGIPWDLHPSVVSYIRTDEEMLHKFDPKAVTFPCPRTWTKVGLRFNQKVPGSADHAEIVERMLLEGSIGVEAANTFWGHLQIFRNLRDPKEIIANPEKVPVPDISRKDGKGLAIMFAELTSLARLADATNGDAIMRYFNRLPGEYTFTGYRDILMRNPAVVAKSKPGQAWMTENSELILNTKG